MEQKDRKPYIVDTNVLVVANRRGGESRICANECAQALLDVQTSGRLVLDDDKRIVNEYLRNCAAFTGFGAGDVFVKWVNDMQGYPHLIEKITITPKGADPKDFVEFPDHPGLSKFDRSDRKFVAVANGHPESPPIFEATDSKWCGWNQALKECGIEVKFLCPEEIMKVYKQKFGGSS